MRIRSALQPVARAGGWANRRRVTFIVTLAAGGSVTFAAASAGLSRQSANALKTCGSAFSSLWERALKARKASHRDRDRVEGDNPRPRDTINFVNLRAPDRSMATAGHDLFFASLQLRLPGASSPKRISQGSCQE